MTTKHRKPHHNRPPVGKLQPNVIARQVVQQYKLVTDPFGNTYRYNGTHWELLDDRVLEKLCRLADNPTFTGRTRVRDTAYYVKSYTLMDDGIPWNHLKITEVPFQNGVYDLAKLEATEVLDLPESEYLVEIEALYTKGLRPHQPEDYLETVWPVKWNPFATCPTWDRYLQDCFGSLPEFEETVEALEEFLGYLLMTKAPYKKALLCYGESNTGKTVLEHIMIALVGENNICHIPIDKMCDARAIAPIKGKALNVIGELKFDTILSDSGFKRLVSTGEPVELDRKYKDPETYRPFCKHAVFTNSLPVIHDYSEGVFNRLLLLQFPNVIPREKQDPFLTEKLLQEIDGIALRALDGLARLIDNQGQFTMPMTVEAMLSEYKEETNIMFEFLNDYFKVDPTGHARMDQVRTALWEYAPKCRQWTPARISQALKAAGCDIQKTTRHGQKGKFLLGYTLLADPRPNPFPVTEGDDPAKADTTQSDDLADF